MTAAALLPWVLLAWFFGKKDLSTHATTPAAAAPKPTTVPTGVPTAAPGPKVVPVSYSTPAAVKVQPAPWPQVVPAGLPAFPGPQWVPDNPPGAGVVSRANQLIPVLWAHGPGTFKTEMTAGRWITYRATPMGEKKGVVAFKQASEPTTALPPEPAIVPPPVSPGYTPPEVVPASTRPPTAAASTAAPSVALRTLRLTSPRMTGPDVKTLQVRLGIGDDGVFGTGTVAAVKAYQSSHGLQPDGVVGPKTWGSLFGRAA